MKPATGLVLLLVVAIVLYLVALGAGFAFNDRERKSGGGSWEKALGNLTAPLAPRLELGGIACNGQPVRQPFKLTQSRERCELVFPRSRQHEYRKAELEFLAAPESKGLAVFVRGKFSDEQRKEQNIDRSMCRQLVPPAGAQELPSNVRQSPFRLEIEFVPNEDGESHWDCWLTHEATDPYGVTVLEDGATLRLTCDGCSADQQREVTLRMK